ncbi:DUF4919 domain-containing protein [Microbulbifer thermotolerans]|uniref:DUF4919 domain-containing protein n=1 Tax=Microbulbifer thermotolerans TaxID=252514 RepID=UPI0022492FD9|nr:DUF4919 domain-containing protein [Microbulbifer thermotolerans]MCX2796093.1 DUF4919 domain-containing protein [Microbulbifer thermotolerans]MCX2832190.1 DUF4919 domain-containing protein [Microbulbifer thermotolerans]
MKHYIFIVFLLICGCAVTNPQGAIEPSQADNTTDDAAPTHAEDIGDSNYQQALEILKNKGSKAEPKDFQRVREAYANSSKYFPYFDPTSSLVEMGFESLNKSDWATCINAANEIVKANYTSLPGHFLGMACNMESGNTERGEVHKLALNGFIEAIWSTGDGKKMESAFHTYSTPELRAFLQLQGLEIIDQALLNGEEGVFDLMGVRDPQTGDEFKLYFNITHQWVKGASSFQ